MTMDRTTDADTGGFRPPRGFLSGRTALVTGASRRIGRHLALALAHEGATVIVHYRASEQEAAATAGDIAALGVSAHLVQGDLEDAGAAAELIDRAAETAAAPVDILINNASIFGPGGVAAVTSADWDRFQAVNLRAPLLLARGLARRLPEGAAGDVVNIGDIRVLGQDPDYLAYTMSKMGLHDLTRSLAAGLAPRVRVNELLLGPVLAPEIEVAGGDYEHVPREALPTRRFPTLDDVASGMLFFLGCPAVTGQSICIDGGAHLR